MTFTVIDTIDLQSVWTHRYPEIAARGEGVLGILDPAQIQVAPEISGREVTIYMPDGSAKTLVAASAEAHHAVVSVFFRGASKEDLPRGAELEW